MSTSNSSESSSHAGQGQRGSTTVIVVLAVLLALALAYGLGARRGGTELERRVAALESQLKGVKTGAPVANPGAANPRPPPPPITLKTGIEMKTAGMPSKGQGGAPVTMIEYSDFQCPFCGRYVKETLPTLLKEYVESGKVRYVFRHFPIDSLHPQAPKSAEAATCAQAQGRFWEMHHVLFDNPRKQAPAELTQHARDLGLNMASFDTCMKGAAAGLVREDLRVGADAGIMGTPAFFMGTTKVNGDVFVTESVYGAKPYEAFKAAIEAALVTASRR